jgi:small subunit ribosomal protein S9
MTKKVKQKVEKEVKKKEKKEEIIFKLGKRKRAVAKVVIKPGSGKITINGMPLENMKSDIVRLRIMEPFMLINDETWKNYDFMASVKGGGIMGQADAVRQAFARGLVDIYGNEVKQRFIEYDRNLLVYDPRRTEPHKPPHSSWGPRRYKQRSKR